MSDWEVATPAQSNSDWETVTPNQSSASPSLLERIWPKLPNNLPEFQRGSPQNKELVNELIGSAVGAPGIEAGLAKLGSPLLNTVKSAFGGIKPQQEAYQQALQKAQEAKANFGTSDEALNQAKAQSQMQVRESNPALMQNTLAKRQQDIQGLTNKSDNLNKELLAIKPEENALPNAEQNLNAANEAHQTAQLQSQAIDNDIARHLNQGAAHDVRAAAGIDSRVQSIENYWNDAYKTFESNIRDAKFEMPQEAMNKLDYSEVSPYQAVKTYGNDAFEAIKQGKLNEFLQKQGVKEKGEEANSYFDNLMEAAPTSSDTNASDFLAKYKDFRDRLYKLGQRLGDPRVEEVEKQKIESALKQGRSMQGQMKEALNTGLGEYKPEFERINKGYSEQIYPLRDNPIVQKAREGKLPDNMMKAMRTDESGMPLVREIVKQDPEVLRNVVGQRYFSKPNEILNPNENTLEYLQEMPDLRNMISQRSQVNDALQQTKSNVDLAKNQHQDILQRTAQAGKTQQKISDINEKIAGHTADIPKIQENINRIQEVAQKRNISLKEKMSAESKLRDLRKDLANAKLAKKKAMGKLKATAKVGGAAIGIPYGFHVLAGLFSNNE